LERVKRLLVAAALALTAACAHAPRTEGNAPPSPAAPAAAPLPPAPPQPPQPPAGVRAEAAPPAAPEQAPAKPEAPGPVTFALVGDVMLGSSFPDETGGLLPPEDGKTLLAEVKPLLSAADVAFANLEGPLADSGQSEKCARSKPGRCYAFRVPTRYGKLLADAGIDVVSLANNHVGDFGDAGRASTRVTLDALGIRYAGAPGEVARLEVRGRRIALVAFSTSSGTNDLRDLPEAARIVREARQGADLVVVSMHGGAEGADRQHVPPGHESFLGEDRGDLRAFARAVIDAGADLVVGHGPHVVRGMEVVKGRLVVYSLGNFATYGGMNLSGPNGLTLVLDVTLAPDGTFVGGKIHPARQERPGGPRLDPTGAVIGVVRKLSQEDFGPTAVRVADDGSLSPPSQMARTTARQGS
jgi:hypothetical protein